jgi:hypothetical protein
MENQRTFENFKKAVVKESKHYPSLKKLNGEFNENYLRAAFDSKMSAIQTCNSMTEQT